MARWWAHGALAALLAACGGQSVRHDAPGLGADTAGRPAAAGGSGGTGAGVPTKNGVPISDCTEPSAEQQMQAGCPVVEPVPGDDCDLAENTRCNYAIVTDPNGTWSEQRWTKCEGHEWTMIFLELCGMTCESAGPVRVLDTSDCLARTVTPCPTTEGPDDSPISAQTATAGQFYAILFACGLPRDGVQKVEVEFVDGCAATLSTLTDTDPAIAECTALALAEQRWACAETTLCAFWDTDIR